MNAVVLMTTTLSIMAFLMPLAVTSPQFRDREVPFIRERPMIVPTRIFGFLLFISLTTSGCSDPMTYQEFSRKFQEQCPDYLVRALSVLQEPQKICRCMHKTIVEKWPNMNTLLAGIRQSGREPRGETDFIPHAIQIAVPYCMKSEK